jgi:hypothetical protein
VVLLPGTTVGTEYRLPHLLGIPTAVGLPSTTLKLAIFERLWKDNPSYIKRAKIHFSQDRATRQRNIETLDTEP